MRRIHILALAVLAAACGDGSQATPGTCAPVDPSQYPLNMEMREVTSPFTRNVYGCRACTRADFDAIVTPEGWEKNVPNRILSIRSSLEPFEVEGVPSRVSFSDAIPGDEWELIAQVENVSFDTGAPVATVRRSTVFTLAACNRQHFLTDPSGNVFVLFGVIDDLFAGGLDLQAADAFADRRFPPGWTYGSDVLEDDMVVDSGGRALVYNHAGESTWQMLR